MFNPKLIFMLLLVLGSQTLLADDLDDGIGGDEPIEDKLQINKNIEYIKRNALAKAQQGGKKAIVNCGAGNMNFAPGTKFAAGTTIVNLSDNKNSASICGKKAAAAKDDGD